MTTEELYDKLKLIQKMKCETQNLELKSAEQGYPKRLYDSLSSFSNQDDGGIIVFGIDEKQDYKEVGVYDAQDIQKKINEQCLQMNPVVRPLITVVEKENKKFVSAEIPGIDLADRPCYYQGRGRLKGSYTRIGDSDEPMTEYAFIPDGHSDETFKSIDPEKRSIYLPNHIEDGKIIMGQQLLFFINQGKYYKEDELRYKHFEVDIVGMKWNIYTSTIYYKRLQVTFTATLSRPGSDTKKVLKGKFMQRYPYDCSEIHHEVKDSLED